MHKAIVVTLIVAVGLVLSAAQTATAQPQEPAQADLATLRGQVSLRGQFGVPLGDFSDNVGLSGGISGDFTYRLGDTPFRIGAGMSVLWYGRETRRVPLSATIPDVLVDVTTSSGIWTTHALLRVQNGEGRVRPYGDALVGFNYVFTETSADLGDDPFFEQTTARTTNFSDFALSVGGGGGVMFDLVTWDDRRLSLDLGARFLFGAAADYLVPTLLRFGGEVADLRVNRSRTDVLTIHGGVVFEF